MFHSALPLLAYAVLALSSIMPYRFYLVDPLFIVGGVALSLLFIGIHNAWDSVSYHVFVTRPKAHSEQGRNEPR